MSEIRDLLVITPSREREEQLREMLKACLSLSEADTDIAVANDDDDLYDLRRFEDVPHIARVLWHHGPRAGLGTWTNRLAALYTGRYDEYRALGGPVAAEPRTTYRAFASLGDDHFPRTQGWDRLLLQALDAMGGQGIAYGDDMHQRHRLPTAPVISAGIVEALGWMCEPSLRHMYVDNVWRDLGLGAGCLAYVLGVVIEHLHPAAGKAVTDPTYEASMAAWDADGEAYEQWRRDRMAADVGKVQAVVAGTKPHAR